MVESLVSQSLPLLLVLAGAGLMIAEALAPGAHFIVIGVALFAAGVVGLLLPPIGLFAPLVLAFVVLVVGGITFYGYQQFDFYGGSGEAQTSDSDDLRGKSGRVTERVTEAGGEVKLTGGGFNPYYRARTMGGEIPEGTEVLVIDPGGGNVVTVEAMDRIEDDIDRELARSQEDHEAETDAASEADTA